MEGNTQNQIDPSDEENSSVSVVFAEMDPSSSNALGTNSKSPQIEELTAHDNALAKAITSVLSTVIRQFDSTAQDTIKSQEILSLAIDRLTRELDQLLEDAPVPFIMQHAAKISAVRKRVLSLNSLLKSIQRRVDNVDRMLTAGMLHEKTTTESSIQH